MKNIFNYFAIGFGVILLAAFSFVPRAAHALSFSVMPAVIDAHGLPRDILNYSLTVENGEDRPVNVFASIYNLTADGKQNFADTSLVDASLAAKSVSFANWVGVERGAILFAPRETKTIPVSVNINPFAAAGSYHAVIAFVAGNTRDEAEKNLSGAPQALFNLEVASNIKEELQMVSFSPLARFASAFPLEFSYTLKNIGTGPSTPYGTVIFYDRIGHEIGSVDANPDHLAISPGETHDFQAKWGDGMGFGQYKAMLDLTYGAALNKLQDTALVWVLPWKELSVLFIGFLVIVIFLSVWLHGRYEKRHHAHMGLLRRLLSNRNVVDLRNPHDIRDHA